MTEDGRQRSENRGKFPEFGRWNLRAEGVEHGTETGTGIRVASYEGKGVAHSARTGFGVHASRQSGHQTSF
jgi:hypothetical protein